MKKNILLKIIIVFLCCFTYMSVVADAAVPSTNTAPTITAESAIVADADTGRIYYQKNMHEQMYPASITKILTGIVAVENSNPQDVITIPDDISQGMPSNAANIALTGGEQITVDEALYTMFLASANDSANALALHVGGTIDNFVGMMNDRARQLGAVDSHFSNANGLPDKNNYTSAFDMALITQKALEEPEVMKYFGARTYIMPTTNKRSTTEAFSTLQKMMKDTVYQYQGTIAGKTGWETMSGHTMVTAATRNGRTLICVVMKSSDQYTIYNDTIALLNYGFAQPDTDTSASYLQPKTPITVKQYKATASAVTSPKSTDGNTIPITTYIALFLLLASTGALVAIVITNIKKGKTVTSEDQD